MKLKTKYLFLTVLLAVAILLTGAGRAAAAGTVTLSMTPSSGSYTQDGTVQVSIYEDSGTDSIITVQSDFLYPASQLSFVSFDFAGSAFGVGAQADSSTPGLIKISRGQIGGLSGRALIGTVNFKVIQTGGTANLTFNAATSKVALYTPSASTIQYATLAYENASYALTSPPVTPPATTSPPPATSPTGTKTTTKTTTTVPKTSSTPAASTPAPQLTISNVAIQSVSGTKATITWTTSLPATSSIDYGLTTQYIFNASSRDMVTSHSVTLDSSNLNANTTYHYRVSSVDAQGGVAAGPDSTFTTGDGKAITGFGLSTIKPNSKIIFAVASISALALLLFAISLYLRHMHETSMLTSHGIYVPATSIASTRHKKEPTPIIIAGGAKPQAPPVALPPQPQAPPVVAVQNPASPKPKPGPTTNQAAEPPAEPAPPEDMVVFTDKAQTTIKPKPNKPDKS